VEPSLSSFENLILNPFLKQFGSSYGSSDVPQTFDINKIVKLFDIFISVKPIGIENPNEAGVDSIPNNYVTNGGLGDDTLVNNSSYFLGSNDTNLNKNFAIGGTNSNTNGTGNNTNNNLVVNTTLNNTTSSQTNTNSTSSYVFGINDQVNAINNSSNGNSSNTNKTFDGGDTQLNNSNATILIYSQVENENVALNNNVLRKKYLNPQNQTDNVALNNKV
jgi:hypothetical protein